MRDDGQAVAVTTWGGDRRGDHVTTVARGVVGWRRCWPPPTPSAHTPWTQPGAVQHSPIPLNLRPAGIYGVTRPLPQRNFSQPAVACGSLRRWAAIHPLRLSAVCRGPPRTPDGRVMTCNPGCSQTLLHGNEWSTSVSVLQSWTLLNGRDPASRRRGACGGSIFQTRTSVSAHGDQWIRRSAKAWSGNFDLPAELSALRGPLHHGARQ